MTNPIGTQQEQSHTVLVHYHTDPLRCGHCKSKNVKYYDGCLGYEAIRCHDCHIESDRLLAMSSVAYNVSVEAATSKSPIFAFPVPLERAFRPFDPLLTFRRTDD